MKTFAISQVHRSWTVYQFLDKPGHFGSAQLVGSGFKSRRAAMEWVGSMAGVNDRIIAHPALKSA